MVNIKITFITFSKGPATVSKIIFRNHVYLFLFCRHVTFWVTQTLLLMQISVEFKTCFWGRLSRVTMTEEGADGDEHKYFYALYSYSSQR